MKYLYKIVLILTVIILISSCANTSSISYTVYEIASYDYVSEANHSKDIELLFETSEEFKIVKNKNVELLENEYQVTYDHTLKIHLYQGIVDYYYSNSDDGKKVTIGINKYTDRIDVFAWTDKNYLNDLNIAEKDKDECLEIAKQHLSEFCSVDEYTLVDEIYKKSSQYGGIYQFNFVKFIDELKTCENVYIEVTVHGIVKSHTFRGMGVIDESQIPEQQILDEVRSKIDDKLDDIYSNMRDKYNITYGEKDEIFVRLNDGRYALEYYVDVTIQSYNSEVKTPMETNHFIVYLD